VSPSSTRKRPLSGQICTLDIPLEPDPEASWTPHYFLKGRTRDGRKVTAHASVLLAGHCPHPPHQHKEEEILILLSGSIDLVLPAQSGGPSVRLQPGQGVYYPALFSHTLISLGPEPAEYLMFKWSAHRSGSVRPLDHVVFDTRPVWTDEGGRAEGSGTKGYHASVLFEGPTTFLRKLHAHLTSLAPGAGYQPHADAHDVLVLVLDGEVETLQRRLTPFHFAYSAAGELHGMRNPTDRPARYLVFEFHPLGPWWRKLVPRRWRR
jgi:quercetin dioxygenase-like cupin family protein